MKYAANALLKKILCGNDYEKRYLDRKYVKVCCFCYTIVRRNSFFKLKERKPGEIGTEVFFAETVNLSSLSDESGQNVFCGIQLFLCFKQCNPLFLALQYTQSGV